MLQVVFQCSFYLTITNHVPLARSIAKHLSKGFRVPCRRKKGSRIVSLLIHLRHQFQNFADISQHAWSRFPSFNQRSGVKTAEFPQDTTLRVVRCTLWVASIPFSPLSRWFLCPKQGNNVANHCRTIAPQKFSQLLCSACHLRCNHTFFSHSDICNDVSKIMRLMLQKCFSIRLAQRGYF